MAAQFICTITRMIYGESGTELPPPVKETQTFTVMSEPGETKKEFSERMAALVLPYRQRAAKGPVNPYSEADGWGWVVNVVEGLPPLGFFYG